MASANYLDYKYLNTKNEIDEQNYNSNNSNSSNVVIGSRRTQGQFKSDSNLNTNNLAAL
jgi:hypothetical protein